MKSPRKTVFYDDLTFEVFEEVYEPAEDSFLIADAVKEVVKLEDDVLDAGTGCGLLAVVAAKKAHKVVATDLNPHAVECARLNARKNGLAGNVEVRLGDLFQPVLNTEKFDLILFNAPYLPSAPDDQKTWIERAWAGGPTGRLLIDRFIVEAPLQLKRNGKMLLAQSSLADIDKTLRKLSEKRLVARIVAEKKEPFEKIVVIQASDLSR